MGEAKLRRQNDPHFGRPVRGLILTCPIEPIGPNGLIIHSTSIDPQVLRHALLFWDQIVWPKNNVIGIEGGGPDVQFLEETRILSRPRYVFSGRFSGPEPLVRSQIEAFNDLNGGKTGTWDICQDSMVLLGHAAQAIRGGGVGLELIEAIPVPDKEVPLNEVLEFKRRRSDELCALRVELDNLAQIINGAADLQAELRTQIAHIDKVCSDVLRVSAEWQFPVRLANRKMALDLKPFEVLAGAVAAISGVTFLTGAQATMAAIGGAVVGAKSAIKITGDIGWKGLKPRKTPFAYVAHFNKELF